MAENYKQLNHSAEEIDEAILSEKTHVNDNVSHITAVERVKWNKVDNLQAQLNNLVINGTPTEGNAELLDMRVGADGETYEIAGEGVRTQFKNITDSLLNLQTIKSLPLDYWNDGKFQNSDSLAWIYLKPFPSGYLKDINVYTNADEKECKVYIYTKDSNDILRFDRRFVANGSNVINVECNTYFDKEFYVAICCPNTLYTTISDSDYYSVSFMEYSNTIPNEHIEGCKSKYFLKFDVNMSSFNDLINMACFSNAVETPLNMLQWFSNTQNSDGNLWLTNYVHPAGFVKSVNVLVADNTDVTLKFYKIIGDMCVLSNTITANGSDLISIECNINIDTPFYMGIQGSGVKYRTLSDITAKTGAVSVDVVSNNTVKAFSQGLYHCYQIIRGNTYENLNGCISNESTHYDYQINKGIKSIGIATKRIAFIGDSIVAGEYTSDYNGGANGTSGILIDNNVKTYYRNTGVKCWVGKLIDYLTTNYPNVTAFNNGIGGLTTMQIYNNLETLTLNDDGNRANVAVVSIGTNDRNNVNSLTYLVKIIQWCKERDIQPVILTNTPIVDEPKVAARLQSYIIRHCEVMRVPAYPVFTEVMDYIIDNDITLSKSYNKTDFYYDSLHPADGGHDVMFKTIRRLLNL